MFIVEELLQPFPLDDQRVKRRQQVNHLLSDGDASSASGLTQCSICPLLLSPPAKAPCVDPRFNQAPNGGFSTCVKVTDRIETDQSLATAARDRADRPGSAVQRPLRPLLPAEMAVHELIRFDHAEARADGQRSGEERQLQCPFRWLPAGPGMVLFDQQVVVDVANRQRAIIPDKCDNPLQIFLLHRAEPALWRATLTLHRRRKNRRSLLGT